MRKRSAGILLYRVNGDTFEFLLAHPGGPFYKNKDMGVWTIPKGEFEENEDPREAAVREFKEELGADISGEMIPLKPIIQKSGKEVLAWAVQGDFNPDEIVSNTFLLEWPPKSGKTQQYAEVDKAEWFDAEMAKKKILPAQLNIIEELEVHLASGKNAK